MVSKRGLPRALEEELAEDERQAQRTEELQDFLEDMFPDGAATPQDGLPSLAELKKMFKTKSAAIRYLINQGHEVKLIAKHLGIRYQHVRNVKTQILKRGPNESWIPAGYKLVKTDDHDQEADTTQTKESPTTTAPAEGKERT